METTTPTDAGRHIMEAFVAAEESGDLEALKLLVHDDVVMEWPQSGERFTGRDNALAAITATEVKPELAGEPRIVGCGDVWILAMPLRYGADLYHYVGVFELADGRIRRSTEYFAAPFPAQEGRARYADGRADATG
jgi:ketosteroid isomerase-like protein